MKRDLQHAVKEARARLYFEQRRTMFATAQLLKATNATAAAEVELALAEKLLAEASRIGMH